MKSSSKMFATCSVGIATFCLHDVNKNIFTIIYDCKYTFFIHSQQTFAQFKIAQYQYRT